MNAWKQIIVAPLLALAFVGASAVAQTAAQRPPPHIGFVYPAGGQQGTTFTVSVGGQNLNEKTSALFTGQGVTAKFTGYERPLSGKIGRASCRERVYVLV